MSEYIEKINRWFGKSSSTIIKYRWLIIVAILAISAIQFVGMTRLRIENSAESWLLQNDPLRVAEEEFKEIFGNNDYVIILVEADNVFSTKVLRMMRELGDELEREVPFAKEVTSLTHLEFTKGTVEGINVDELVPVEIPTDSAELEEIRSLAMTKEYLVDRLFSPDGRKAAIVLELKTYPKEDPETGQPLVDLDSQRRVKEEVQEIISDDKYEGYSLLAGGMPIMLSEDFEFTNMEMGRILGITLLVMVILLAVVFRSFVGVLAPVLTAITSVIWILGAMGWLGINIQESIMIIPLLLILVVSVGYCVHILSFFRQGFLATGDRKESIEYALKHSAWPILFTVLTTAMGFLSFLIVQVNPIQMAGGMSAALVMVSYPILILMTPVLLSFGKNREPNPGYADQGESWPERTLVALGEWVRTHGLAIVVLFGLVTFIFVLYIPGIDVDTDFLKISGLQVPYMARAYHIANSIGSLYSYDATFDFGEENRAKDPEVLKKLDSLASEMLRYKGNKRTSSITDIVKDLNKTLNSDEEEYYRIPDDPNLVAQLLLLYEMSGGTEAEDWIDYEYRIPRLQVEMRHYSSQETEEQLKYLQARAAELFPGAKLGVSGLAVTFAKMINYLVDGQIRSILIALGCISIVMMVVFGSVRLGLIGMIPNLTPVVFVIGGMSIAGASLNMLTIMIAPMIIGLAVDDTIHYINHFKQAFWRTGSYAEANKETFRTVGKAIFLTSFVICLGFLTFTTSLYNAFREIGVFTVLAVGIALLADYLVTPVLIIWTKAFGPERAVGTSTTSSPATP